MLEFLCAAHLIAEASEAVIREKTVWTKNEKPKQASWNAAKEREPDSVKSRGGRSG